MRALRFLLATMIGVALVPLAAGAASAAPPANDEATGAVVLNLGDHVVQDTTEATTNAGDTALNANCGAPATNASVWYQYSPGADHVVALDSSASDYSTGLMVFRGTPTADSLITCGPVSVGLRAKAGDTYFIMAFSDTDANGGTLDLTLKNAPTPRAHVRVAYHGVAFHGGGGAARLHGTYSCKHDESFAELTVNLRQRAGRLKVQGDSFVGVRCDGKRRHWSARVVSPFGTYAAGLATARVRIDVCGLVQCSHDTAKHRVRLAWAHSSRLTTLRPTTAGSRPQAALSLNARWPSAWGS